MDNELHSSKAVLAEVRAATCIRMGVKSGIEHVSPFLFCLFVARVGYPYTVNWKCCPPMYLCVKLPRCF